MIDVTELGSLSRTRTAVRLDRRLSASPVQVWAAWTDPVRLGRWLAPVESGAPGPGQTFVLRMAPRETATCTVTAWEPPRRLDLIWDYSGEGRSRFRLRLRGLDDGGTHVLLDHDRLHSTSNLVEYAAGWHTHVEGLVAHLRGAPRPDFDPTFRSLHAAYLRRVAELDPPSGTGPTDQGTTPRVHRP